MQPHRRKPIRVLVVDDHRVVREGVTRLLREQCHIEVVGEADNGQTAIEMAGQMRPDVVIMDINMPGMNGIEATRKIREQFPQVRIVGLSMHEEREIVALMKEAGAQAYVAKDRPLDELLLAIRSTAEQLQQLQQRSHESAPPPTPERGT